MREGIQYDITSSRSEDDANVKMEKVINEPSQLSTRILLCEYVLQAFMISSDQNRRSFNVFSKFLKGMDSCQHFSFLG
jgi:hypothetical protein